MDYSKILNKEQAEAVLYNDGPLLILAGAGSGKTRVLTYKMAYLIQKCGVHPDSILGVTFTNKAAQEMKERVANLLGARKPVWICTFHSACVRILRRDADKLGISKNFVIYDEYDKGTKVKEIIKELNINDKRITPGSVIGAISRAKNGKINAAEYKRKADDFFTQLIAEIYEIYEKETFKDNALDFDDLLVKTVELFEKFPDTLAFYKNKFKHILVDEYQDINYIQYLLIKHLAGVGAHLTVVGDDDQSIYGFRGADISIILQFEKDFPNSKVIKLEQNYRSTKIILEAANGLVKNNAGRKQKKLWTENSDGELITHYCGRDEEDEARYTVNKIKELTLDGDYGRRDIVILYRTNAQSRAFEEFLISAGIPYKIIGGIKFYSRKEIKDIIAYLRVLLNPNDSVSLKRILNVPARGIGLTSLEKMYKFGLSENLSLYDALKRVDEINIQQNTKTKIKNFFSLLEELKKEITKLSVTDLAQFIMQKSGMKDALVLENTTEARTRLENLEEFLSVTHEFEKKTETPSLENFLAEVSLISDIDNYDEQVETVTLMTLHSSKGLEFPVVFMGGMEEGIFPHSRSLFSETEIEEERRLCYVGITRARQKLYMLSAECRMIFGNSSPRATSRFLDEIDKDFINDETVIRSSFVAPSHPRYRMNLPAADSNSHDNAFVPNFKTGQKVLHHLWGGGMVKNVEDEEITVEFEKIGTKIILAEYLKPVEAVSGKL